MVPVFTTAGTLLLSQLDIVDNVHVKPDENLLEFTTHWFFEGELVRADTTGGPLIAPETEVSGDIAQPVYTIHGPLPAEMLTKRIAIRTEDNSRTVVVEWFCGVEMVRRDVWVNRYLPEVLDASANLG